MSLDASDAAMPVTQFSAGKLAITAHGTTEVHSGDVVDEALDELLLPNSKIIVCAVHERRQIEWASQGGRENGGAG